MNWFLDTLFGGRGSRYGGPMGDPIHNGSNLSPPIVPKGSKEDGLVGKLNKQLVAQNLNPMDAASVINDSEPAMLTSAECRQIARFSLIAPGILLRVRQSEQHGVKQSKRSDVGYAVGMRDPEARMSDRDKKRAKFIEEILERGEPFSDKLGKLARDSFEIDRAVAQIAFSVLGKPMMFTVEDAATFRHANPKPSEVRDGRLEHERPYVQWQNNRIEKVFHPRQLLWIQRNTRTDVEVRRYGYTEVEMAFDIILDLLKAQSFNSNFWENGVHAAILMKVKSGMDDEQFEGFKRQFVEQGKGLGNAHKLLSILLKPEIPGATKGDDVEIENLGGSPKDMEFRWAISFFYRVLAAIMGFDLEEIGLGDPADTGKSTLQEADASWKQVAGRERGLMPWLRKLADEINRKIIWPHFPDLSIRFRGLEALTAMDQAMLDEKLGDTMMPLNELRDAADKPRLKWKLESFEDEAPLKYQQAWLQMWQAKQQAAQQAQMAAQQAQQQPPDGEDYGQAGGPPGGPGGPQQDPNAMQDQPPMGEDYGEPDPQQEQQIQKALSLVKAKRPAPRPKPKPVVRHPPMPVAQRKAWWDALRESAARRAA